MFKFEVKNLMAGSYFRFEHILIVIAKMAILDML